MPSCILAPSWFDAYSNIGNTLLEMYPILLQIGHLKVYSFGTFIALGTILAGLLIGHAAKKRKLKTHYLFDTVLFTLIIGIIAARLTYYFLYANQFNGFDQVLLFWQSGGFVGLGGLIVGFISYLYFVKRERDPIWQMLDIGSLGLLIGWAFGKTGCFLSSCTIGQTTSGFLSINGTYPVDMFSAVWVAVLFVILGAIWFAQRLSEGVIFFLAIEGLLLGQLLINTLNADFGTGLARVESLTYLFLIIVIYLLFWKMHGPKIEKNRWGVSIKNFVFRRK